MDCGLLNCITEWVQLHRNILEWLGVWSIVAFVVTLVIVPVLVVRMSSDYLVIENPNERFFRSHYPVLRYLILVAKNLAGVMFLLVGIALLLLPGQGLITIFIGIMLMDFPRKRALELHIIRQSSILKSINWMRAKAHRPPLQIPPRKQHE